MFGKFVIALFVLHASFLALFAETAEIKVDLKFDGEDFISGERIRGIVNVVNPSPSTIRVGTTNAADRLFVEVYRASDQTQLTRVSKHPFVSAFVLKSNEGQKLETFVGDHYALRQPSRYLAKPVLVHNGARYEGQLRAFDVVDGIKIGGATQLFKNHPGLQREFTLVYGTRKHSEHVFLTAQDAGTSTRKWETRDLGPILRQGKGPATISILPTGEVVVLHRLNSDNFVRSEFWSLPKALEFRRREAVGDPETAGTARVRELYKNGGVQPKTNPWWKFW